MRWICQHNIAGCIGNADPHGNQCGICKQCGEIDKRSKYIVRYWACGTGWAGRASDSGGASWAGIACKASGAGRGDVKRKVAITLKNQGEIKNKRLSHYAESRPGKTGRLFCVVGLERRKIFLVEN